MQCLKEYRCIILQFWRSEVWNGSYASNIKVLTEGLLSGAPGGESVSFALTDSRIHMHSLTNSLFFHSQRQHHSFFKFLPLSLTFASIIRSLSLTLLPPSCKNMYDYIRLTLITLDTLPIWRSFISHICKIHLTCVVTYSQVPDIRVWTFFFFKWKEWWMLFYLPAYPLALNVSGPSDMHLPHLNLP